MNYTEKLDAAVRASSSNVVVGLDVDLEKIPSFLLRFPNPALEFNKLIIDATRNHVAGYKLNIAFYEYLEEKGLEAVRGTLEVIPDNLIKICDAKRGDIGNTSELYARTYFDKYRFDSLTVNAYMGKDSLEPFFKREGKLIYILALTSNHSSIDFQHEEVSGEKLYMKIINKALSWRENQKTGFVFGANYVNELKDFTTSSPDIPLLIPGVGAQGNELRDLIKNLHTNRYLINSSRAIIYSAGKDCNETQFHETVSGAAEKLSREIRELKVI